MEAMNANVEVKRLLPAWDAFCAATDIAPVRSKAHYRRMVAMLEALLDEAGGDESHPAMSLADIVGDLIENYEAVNHPPPPASGLQALKFLMEQHGLRQGDLQEVGSQGVVSEILAGKRELNLRQVRALAERFGVSPSTFI
jgi:HTH-type transcriptional regulator / antitoxin HigA